jgi:predicted NAD-dependent protein-ADP-ribosyltransferase YbiA (DUF1768 family)
MLVYIIMYFNNTSDLSPLSPHPIRCKGITYPSVMHYFVCQKFQQKDLKINGLSSDSLIKRNNSKRYATVPGWDTIKYTTMYKGCLMKFEQHPTLLPSLLAYKTAKWKPSIPIPYWDYTGDNKLSFVLNELLVKLDPSYVPPVKISGCKKIVVPRDPVLSELTKIPKHNITVPDNIELSELKIESYI